MEKSRVTSNGDAPYRSAQNVVNGIIIPNASMSKNTISNRTLIEPFADALLVIEIVYPLVASFTISRGWSLTTSLDKFRNRDTVQMMRRDYWRQAS